MNEFLLTVFSGLVQFERSMIKQRQKEGIEIAKANGRFKGRKVELIEGGKKAHKASQAIQWYKEDKSHSARHLQNAFNRYRNVIQAIRA